MDQKELIKKEAARLLPEAIEEIKASGMYWNGGISRTVTSTLQRHLEESGYATVVTEVPPLWEHVFDSTGSSYEKLCDIANERASGTL